MEKLIKLVIDYNYLYYRNTNVSRKIIINAYLTY